MGQHQDVRPAGAGSDRQQRAGGEPGVGPIAQQPSGFRGLIGIARRDITPPVGIRHRNWGPATTDTAGGVHRPLTLTAMALTSAAGGDPVLLLAIDGTWWRRVKDEADFRGAVLRELQLTQAQLLCCLSHTHAGPVLCAADSELAGGALIPPYLQSLRDAAVDAGRQALAGRTPATLDWAVGRSDLAANRDLLIDGKPLVGFAPAEPADDTVLVGRISAADGAVLGTLVNYACHPTTLAWQNDLLSPDYVGALRETVERTTGAPCLFLQGASGDLAPREQYTGDTAVVDRHGTAVGHAALAALATMPPAGAGLQLTGVVESGAPLAIWRPVPADLPTALTAVVTAVELPLKPVPTIEDLQRQWAGIDPRSREERILRARHLREGYLQPGATAVRHPVWAVLIGDAVLIAHPGEAYSALQVELRRRFADRAIVVANLTNGPGFVYLPNDRAYARAAYASWQTPLARGALELLTEAAAAAVTALTSSPG